MQEARNRLDGPRAQLASCEEHARVHELAEDVNEAGLAVEIARNWRDVARAWKLEGLEQKAHNILEDLKQDLSRADAKMNLAVEIADAPRKGGENPTLTREQD